MPFGTLTVGDHGIPVFSPPYPATTNQFSDMSMVVITYRISRSQVQHLVPDVLELEEEPLVTSIFVTYGMSTVGAYSEFVQSVEVTYREEKFDYTLVLVLDNESAIFAGREVFGYPKVFGRTHLNSSTGSRLINGGVERPVGTRLAEFEFVPEQLADINPPGSKRTLNLRVIPSPIPGAPPVSKEFIPVVMDMKFNKIWLGKGHVSFPKTSSVDPWCNLDVLRYEGCFFASGVSATLCPPKETFSL
ncbi:Acetoacetate decarboxylase [Neofusicoccum parvum]|nr:Acetoacetate decarboxylase [Neofusicoccum parvum]